MQNNQLSAVTTELEKMAYGLATSQFISCDNGFEGSWYERYQYLAECVLDNKEPEDLAAWQPFETWDWRGIVEQIDNEASSILSTLKQALEYAKTGIVISAANCSLDGDMTQLNMESMLEIGANQ